MGESVERKPVGTWFGPNTVVQVGSVRGGKRPPQITFNVRPKGKFSKADHTLWAVRPAKMFKVRYLIHLLFNSIKKPLYIFLFDKIYD